MDKFIIIHNEDAELKNIYISDAGIKTLSENLETKEVFLKSFDSTSNGALDSKDDILFLNIHSISTFNDDAGIQIIYTKRNGNSETTYLELENMEDQIEIKNFILSKTKLTSIDIQSKNKNTVIRNVFIFILIIGLMFASFNYIEPSKWILIIYFLIASALLFWIKLARTKSSLEQEKFVK